MTTIPDTTRDHGGNLDAAVERYGGRPEEWIDLSTGINPQPYPVPPIPAEAWARLPQRSDMQELLATAAQAYGTAAPVAAFAGAQGAIQLLPYLGPAGRARIVTPTYNEHAGALRAAGWDVTEVPDAADLAGADLAVVVNPNNPDGRRYDPGALRDLAPRVGLLVVDESFADPEPALSLAPSLAADVKNVIVLRSFGKFYGLAGLRLGFALGAAPYITRLRDMAGPWPVSGPAIAIACAAFEDREWQRATCARLIHDAQRLDTFAQAAGWSLVGGTPLFRTYATADASAAQHRLAQVRIWSRIFPYSPNWLRVGLPGSEAHWHRLEEALTRCR